MTPSPRTRFLRSLCGVTGALAVHALVFEATLLGSTARKAHAPQIQGPGAAAFASSAQAAMTLVFIQTPGVTAEEQHLPEAASRGTAAANSPLTVISSDPLPATDPTSSDRDNPADASVDAGDPAARARLFGMYAGQIDARIERAWRRPRSPINEVHVSSPIDSAHAEPNAPDHDRFECRVRIFQEASGQIREVELLSCNGTLAWKQSLLRAVQDASPLPAPPSPAVFSNAITLTFTADAYREGAPEEKYEIDVSRVQALTRRNSEGNRGLEGAQ